MAVILLLLLLALGALVLTGHSPDTRDADYALHPLTRPRRARMARRAPIR